MNSLIIVYELLGLLGIIIVCIGVLADFQACINPFLIIIGGLMAVAGVIFLVDKLISCRLEEKISPKWKTYSEISGYLKWAIVQILFVGFALCYWFVAIQIVRSASLPR